MSTRVQHDDDASCMPEVVAAARRVVPKEVCTVCSSDRRCAATCVHLLFVLETAIRAGWLVQPYVYFAGVASGC